MTGIKEVILYGCGKRCRRIYDYLKKNNHIKVIYMIDSNPDRWGSDFCGYKISSPEVLRRVNKLPLCITVADYDAICEIRKTLQEEYSYEMQNEIFYDELMINAFYGMENVQGVLSSVSSIRNGRKRIVFDCSFGLGLGGIEEWVKNLCAELLRVEWKNICILTDYAEYDIVPILTEIVEKVKIVHNVQFVEENVLNIIKFLCQRLPCKVVANHVDEVMIAAGVIKEFFPQQIEIASVIHGGDLNNYSRQISMKRYIDLYVGVSEDIVREMRQRGIEKSRIFHMTCPVECKETLHRGYTVNKQKKIKLGYAGRLVEKQKRVDLLLKMLDQLEKLQVNYELEIAGEGDGKKDIVCFINDNFLEKKVKLLGTLERVQIPSFWSRQDVCINIADYEGRSISVMEAMANGTVPVVTATSGMREDIKDGENGYIVNVGDYIAMAEKIKYIDEHREMLPQMGAAAHNVIYPKVQMGDHLRFWEKILV